jgi:hypothetical protein
LTYFGLGAVLVPGENLEMFSVDAIRIGRQAVASVFLSVPDHEQSPAQLARNSLKGGLDLSGSCKNCSSVAKQNLSNPEPF